jgi:hypothetical protein
MSHLGLTPAASANQVSNNSIFIKIHNAKVGQKDLSSTTILVKTVAKFSNNKCVTQLNFFLSFFIFYIYYVQRKISNIFKLYNK